MTNRTESCSQWFADNLERPELLELVGDAISGYIFKNQWLDERGAVRPEFAQLLPDEIKLKCSEANKAGLKAAKDFIRGYTKGFNSVRSV